MADKSEPLRNVQLALPCGLVGFLALIWAVTSFLQMMDGIQSQGYVPTEDDYHPASASDATDSAEPTDLVVKVVRVRRNLILGLFYSISVTYALGAAVDSECHIITTERATMPSSITSTLKMVRFELTCRIGSNSYLDLDR